MKKHFEKHLNDSHFEQASWEEALFYPSAKVEASSPAIFGRKLDPKLFLEINTFEDLRQADPNSEALRSPIIAQIAEIFNVDEHEVTKIETVKSGMTNRSFYFSVGEERYIMRIPGEGTDQLINRFEEAAVYHALDGYGLTDDVIYIHPETGYKITRFIDKSRVADPENVNDLELTMSKLREFHNLELSVDHVFDIWKLTNFYESLWNGADSIYPDYEQTKAKMREIFDYLEDAAGDYILCHIDSVPDNFLIYEQDGKTDLGVRLIDWEYAGMQDPAVDIAMFCIYSLYDRSQIDRLIDIYYQGKATTHERTLVYAYIAVCGLLWSNWCEYKSHLGVEFGEYSLRQYRFAKDYYKILKEEMKVL